MSASLDMADLIRTRLLTAPITGELATSVNLTTMEVVIYRQTPIVSQITAAVAKATGGVILITWEGFRIPDGNTARPRLANRYNISVWNKPIIDNNARPADEVVESIINRLWQWVPGGGHAYGEVEVRSGDMVPDKNFLIYDLEITIPTNL
jgi:hypothetical protein